MELTLEDAEYQANKLIRIMQIVYQPMMMQEYESAHRTIDENNYEYEGSNDDSIH